MNFPSPLCAKSQLASSEPMFGGERWQGGMRRKQEQRGTWDGEMGCYAVTRYKTWAR